MADEAGEKMLTEERLHKIASAYSYVDATAEQSSQAVRELLDHIAALSATIKRLETPVADGEVRLAVADLERHWRETPNKELQTWLVDLARLLESQAREIERAFQVLKKHAVARVHRRAAGLTTVPYGWCCHECDAEADDPAPLVHKPGCLLAALSLNSVETREMKP